jgi:hypothetical protein
LTAFDADDTRRLRRYHRQVERLSSYRFLSESTEPMKLRGTIAAAGVGDIRYVGPDSESFDAVAPAFRELYGGGRRNRTSAPVIAKLIGRYASAADTEPGRQLANELREYRRALEERSQRDPRMGILVENSPPAGSSSSLTPRDAIDLLLNGDVFHYDVAKADEFEDAPLLRQGLVMMVHSAIRDVAPLWQKLDRLVSAILAEPALVGDTPSE